jgi:hypothetical protein
MPQVNLKQLDNMFTYHAPKGDQTERYEMIRAAGRALALAILQNTPQSPEQTLAVRDVQRAVMMANCAIATNYDSVWAGVPV